jgi:hypothetical protein
MERVPYFRRSAWIVLLGALLVAAPYTMLYLRSTPDTLPGSLLRLVPIFGALTSTAALILSIQLVAKTSSFQQSFPLLLRMLLFAIWCLSHFVFFTDALTLQIILIDLDLLTLGLLLGLTLAAQFVLPVESSADRLLAIRRLIGYAFGERGPVTFVEEGIARQAFGEDRRAGPGVFLIDHASAVVLRTDTAFTRAAGPGVVFSQSGERCAEALDLRRQVRRIGHKNEENEAGGTEGEVTSEAITQDGITVSADISVHFILDPGHEGSPREGRLADKPPYEFNRASAERAVYAHTYGEFGDVSWTQLPELFVADLWREEVKQWALNDLLNRSPDMPPALEQIRRSLIAKLIPPIGKDYQLGDSQKSTPSRELEILTGRGIRILEITIADLKVPEPVQEERALRWRQSWSGEVQSALQTALERVKEAREQGSHSAARILASHLGNDLLDELQASRRPNQRDTLLALLSDILSLSTKQDTVALDANLQAQLTAMQDELQTLPGNCQEGGGIGQ